MAVEVGVSPENNLLARLAQPVLQRNLRRKMQLLLAFFVVVCVNERVDSHILSIEDVNDGEDMNDGTRASASSQLLPVIETSSLPVPVPSLPLTPVVPSLDKVPVAAPTNLTKQIINKLTAPEHASLPGLPSAAMPLISSSNPSTSNHSAISTKVMSSQYPMQVPTYAPSGHPVASPSEIPLSRPTMIPTSNLKGTPLTPPSMFPSRTPSEVRAHSLSEPPLSVPTDLPVFRPSIHPSLDPTEQPLSRPTMLPLSNPKKTPPISMSSGPTDVPVPAPSAFPVQVPFLPLPPVPAPSSILATTPNLLPVFSVPSSAPAVLPTLKPSFSGRSKGNQPSESNSCDTSQFCSGHAYQCKLRFDKPRCRCDSEWGGLDCSKLLAPSPSAQDEIHREPGNEDLDIHAPPELSTSKTVGSGEVTLPSPSDSSNSDMESDAIHMAAILLGILILGGTIGLCFQFCGRERKEGPEYARVPVLEGVGVHDSNSVSNDDNQWDWDDDDDDIGQIELQGPIDPVSNVSTKTEPTSQHKEQVEEQQILLTASTGRSALRKSLADPIPDDLFTSLGMSAEPAFASRDAFSSTLQSANSLDSTGAAWNDDLDDLDGL